MQIQFNDKLSSSSKCESWVVMDSVKVPLLNMKVLRKHFACSGCLFFKINLNKNVYLR